MKLQEVRCGIRRLCRLLSTTSGAGGLGGSSTHGARQLYSERLSIEDDSPPDPPFCSRKGSDVTDRLPLTSFRALIPSPSSVSLGNFWAHSSLCYASSSAHVFHTTFRFAGATSEREKLVEVGYFPSSDGDEEEEVRGQHEELRKQRSPETPATNISQQNVLQGQLGDLKFSASKDSIGSREPGTDGGTNNTATGKVSDELGWRELGWTRKNVLNWPNAISMARLVSGPLLAWMILQELWGPAFLGLVAAGISDWVDGYVARRMNINSVLGSYLDPMADKFLIGSVAVAMTYTGLLHPALVGLIIARDGGLMGGAFLYRAYSLGWKWKDWRDIFKVNIGGAGKVEPLFISKVNTVLQLALVAVALLQPALSVQDTWALVPLLSWSVVGTTSLSGIAYIYTYLKNPGSLAVLQQGAHVRGSQAS